MPATSTPVPLTPEWRRRLWALSGGAPPPSEGAVIPAGSTVQYVLDIGRMVEPESALTSHIPFVARMGRNTSNDAAYLSSNIYLNDESFGVALRCIGAAMTLPTGTILTAPVLRRGNGSGSEPPGIGNNVDLVRLDQVGSITDATAAGVSRSSASSIGGAQLAPFVEDGGDGFWTCDIDTRFPKPAAGWTSFSPEVFGDFDGQDVTIWLWGSVEVSNVPI